MLRRWLGGFAEYAAIILVVLLAKTAIAEPYYVPSGSMEPTLLIGDELLATKYPYGYSAASLPSFLGTARTKRYFGSLPERGDIVVFRWPGDRSQTWVKRVIGLPGDSIALREGHVIINGTAVGLEPEGMDNAETEYGGTLPAMRYTETLPNNRSHPVFKLATHRPLDDMKEIVVPAGHLFVMGDNRDNSADSRVSVAQGGVGMLPVENLIGRVDSIIGSWDFAMKDRPLWEWPQGLRLSRFFSAVH